MYASFLTLLLFVLFGLIVTELYYGVAISFLVRYKMVFLVSVSSDVILALLMSFVYIKNGHKVSDVINGCCYSCSS